MRRGRDWLEVGGVRVMLITGSFLFLGAGTPWWELTQLSALGFVHLSVFMAYFKKEISRPPGYWSVRFKTVISTPLPTLRAGDGPLSAQGRAACSQFLLEVPTAPLAPWGWGEARGMGRCLPSGLEEGTSPVHSASTARLTPSAFPTHWHLATSPSVPHQCSIVRYPQLPPQASEVDASVQAIFWSREEERRVGGPGLLFPRHCFPALFLPIWGVTLRTYPVLVLRTTGFSILPILLVDWLVGGGAFLHPPYLCK